MSSYDAGGRRERLRLKTQYSFAGTQDATLILDSFDAAGRDGGVSVLDVGCASGFVTKSVFGEMPFVSTVIGIDRDEGSIRRFNEKARDGRFIGAVVDVEAADAEERLREALADGWVSDGIDIGYAALSLYHMRDPVGVLRLVGSVMRPGGLIFARSTDDSTKVAVPDDDGLVAKIIARTAALPNVSDRFHGHKMPRQFAEAGFSDVRVISSSITTDGMDADERKRLFASAFSWRRALFARQTGMADWDAVADAMDGYRWACDALDELERRFENPSFFFSLGVDVCIGRKPE